MTPDLAELKRIAEAATPGSWRREAMGGSSTVLAATKPPRNDTRIPPYGYKEEAAHCLAYPFLDDDGHVRLDFVCFSHEDAAHVATFDPPTCLALIAENAAQAARIEALEAGLREACDLLAERTHGSPARSPGHNGRLRLERALGDRHD